MHGKTHGPEGSSDDRNTIHAAVHHPDQAVVGLQLLAYDLASRRSPHSLHWYALHTDFGPNDHTICVCTNQTHLVLITIGFRRLGGIFQ